MPIENFSATFLPSRVEVYEKAETTSYLTPISPIFSKLPLEIVRLILEASVNQEDNASRQRTMYAYCFLSKEIACWIEPLLYEKVVLESSKQVIDFLRALDIKQAKFLARIVKSVWVLDDSFPVNQTVKFEQLFSKCRSLTSLACLRSSMRILRTIPSIGRPYTLRELTIIQPSSAHYLHIHHLSLQKLHIIDYSGSFLGTLNVTASKDDKLLTALRGIRRICLDSISVPDNYLTWELKHGIIPLLLLKALNADSTVYIRTSWRQHTDKRLLDKYHAKDANKWVEEFDTSAEQFGHRLSVTVDLPSDMEVGLQLTDLQRSRARIGLWS